MSHSGPVAIHELEAAASDGDPRAQLELGAHYLATARYGSDAFTKALHWLTRAAAQNLPEAQWMLGNVYAHSPQLPNAARTAFDWYSRAAAHHCAPAQDRLADLYLLGRGIAPDDAEAFRWYAMSAAQAYPVAQANLAYMHAHGIGTPPDENAATTWFLRAAAMGNTRACFNLGLRYATGVGAPCSVVHALAWFYNAARQGYPLSESLVDRLSSGMTGDAIVTAGGLAERLHDNVEALRRNLGSIAQNLDAGEPAQLQAFNRQVEQHFAQLHEPALSFDTHVRLAATEEAAPAPGFGFSPTAPRACSWTPRIFTIDHFLSLDECAHVMDIAASQLVASQDYHLARGSAETTAFDGEAMVFDAPLCDATLRNIERRIALCTRMPRDHIEPLSVLRYQVGHEYQSHVDFLRQNRLQENDAKFDRGGQRLITFLIYLRAPDAGGETEYVETDHIISGQCGVAVFHYNCLPSNEPDELTVHRGRPIRSGEKWLLRTAIRERSLYAI